MEQRVPVEVGEATAVGDWESPPQAIRTHRTSVLRSGGLPNISRPTLNTFAANHRAASAPTIESDTVSQTCHAGGGALDVTRISIAKVLIGGRKLMTVANVDEGLRAIGAAKSHGIMIINVIGVISDCASRISFTAAPIAAIKAPSVM